MIRWRGEATELGKYCVIYRKSQAVGGMKGLSTAAAATEERF